MSWLRVSLCLTLVACGSPADEPKEQPENSPGVSPSSSTEDASGSVTTGPPLLVDVTAKLGLPVVDGRLPDGEYKMPEVIGPGVGLSDLNADGLLDIVQPTSRMPFNDVAPHAHHIWVQQTDGTFADEAEARGLVDASDGVGLAIADSNDDGHLDVLFANFGRDKFFRGDAAGRFTEVSEQAGITSDDYAVTATWFDYDRDGDLDLYLVNYIRWNPDSTCMSGTGQVEYCGPDAFDPWPDVLYQNQGDGTFADVTQAAGVADPGSGLGVVAVDLTNDGWLDLYVTNDMRENHLWVNRTDGTFREEAMLRGVGVSGTGRPEASMGISVQDLNEDGRLDLFMTHIQGQTNTVYTSVRDGIWADGTAQSGMGKVDTEATGFGCVFFDLEHDGDQDLFVANGRVYRLPKAPENKLGPFWSSYGERDFLYENTGSARFESLKGRAPGLTDAIRISRGVASGDIDGDGDLDLVLHALGNRMRVFENQAATGHWLKVDVRVGTQHAYGAQAVLVLGEKRLVRALTPSASYASWSEPILHFGLGAKANYDALEVAWPDGTRERFAGGSADRTIVLNQGAGESL